ncbi:MAG: dihydroorotate oxidase [Candidatus Gottesmanbacteria bacterium]|nr:dihydroorotate oxidase [Candidatus Gottesmanbacteria bacterium]
MRPIYDPTKTYEDNCTNGPFGVFATKPETKFPVGKTTELLGSPIDVPFGIGAGTLPTAKFVIAAWAWGFSIATYKTVRSHVYPTHPFPNIIKVSTKRGEVHPGDTVVADFDIRHVNMDRDGITNSFAVPSKQPGDWISDASKAQKTPHKGSVMILSFMGTKWEGKGRRGFIDDFARCCLLARKARPDILEVNLSCPNFGAEGLVCNDMAMSGNVLEALDKAKGNTPLLVKIGYFPKEKQNELETLLRLIHRYADGVVGINTISAKVVDKKGNQALPGNGVRLYSGICGPAIRWAGLDFARRAVAYKKRKNWKDFVIIGVGGVTTPAHFKQYMKLGVNAVLSVTGSMWRPTLALDIRKELTK